MHRSGGQGGERARERPWPAAGYVAFTALRDGRGQEREGREVTRGLSPK